MLATKGNFRSKTCSVKHSHSCVSVNVQYCGGAAFAIFCVGVFLMDCGGGMERALAFAENQM